MRKWIFVLMAGMLAMSASIGPALADDGKGKSDWAAVRAATARYHDVASAVADGYVSTEFCVPSPETGAAMGIHYVRFDLLGAPVDPLRPPILLYLPRANGLTLGGVEYFAPFQEGEERPTVLGQPMDGPMEGHGGGMPPHYDLHVWLWQMNPDGLFAEFNPRFECP